MRERREQPEPAECAADDRDELSEGGSITEWILGESLTPARARDAGRAAEERAQLINGVVIGVLVAYGDSGPRVDFAENPEPRPIAARAAVALAAADVGRQVALLFEGGDPARPIVMGLMHDTLMQETRGGPTVAPQSAQPLPEQLVFTAEKEIVLRCGKASITLTRAGKILLRGAYLLTDASGVNRIRGATVEIN